ncbi:BlaI/MecI/CopY family transcriptional regulator [Marinimicrobium sp. LS-A18]|uniref:BlaI/MecI/CopY family transcriptional regulator n=1 Tax=Marinimicrobium sp. LS-A18 TaxID=1381596 RepID=UPI000466D3F2|nr:BlaI/MecI/CopY family transcriptional regulator [Marinimicrobium sp. LS-A18]
MPKSSRSTPTRSEMQILEQLWQCREATAQTIHDALGGERSVGYTGTLKLMQLMHQKGLLGRRREGRSHVYYPLVEEQDTKASLLSSFIDTTFSGSASKLMMHLLGNKTVSRQELDEIREYLDRIEEDKS